MCSMFFRYGGTEAATFCALTTLCNQLETDAGIDVYQVAKLFHNKRPGIWKSKDDILFLYEAMHALITSNTLANPVTADVTTPAATGNHVETSPPTTVTCLKTDDENGGSEKERHVRRHSASSIGAMTGGGEAGSVAPSASSRRHSLPPSSGSAGGDSERSSQQGEEEDEEEETEEEEEKQKLIKPDPVVVGVLTTPSSSSNNGGHAQNGCAVKTPIDSNGTVGSSVHLKNGDAEPVTA